MDKIVKKANNNKKTCMQRNQKNQIAIKKFCIEGGKTRKQSGQKRDCSQRSAPEDTQLMKKMDHGNNANNENKPFDLIKDEDVTIQLLWKELKANRKEQKRKQCMSSQPNSRCQTTVNKNKIRS